MSYTVVLEQEPDNGFVAIVPVLPGCVSQGDTHAQVIANIREAIELYFEDCIAAGDPAPYSSLPLTSQIVLNVQLSNGRRINAYLEGGTG
jgi:predicted RNase H-like HicB family nuclease